MYGEPIATQIAILQRETYWVLKNGYDESWSKVSPGFPLMMDVVRLAHARGLRRMEFLDTEEPWRSIWANGSHSYANLFGRMSFLNSYTLFLLMNMAAGQALLLDLACMRQKPGKPARRPE